MPDPKPRLFSPFAVVLGSLAFTLANLPAIARWSAAPLVAGLAFHFYSPMQADGQPGTVSMPVLMFLGLLLLWLRIPLEVRVARLILKGESPSQFYGLELVEKRTGSYLWAYLRVMCLMVAVLGPAVMAGVLLGGSLVGKEAAGLAEGAAPVAGSFVVLALVYIFLAPRIVTVFPDVAMEGPGILFNAGGLGKLAGLARWRIVAVMAVIWAPEHTVNALHYLAAESEWWKALADEWWFNLAGYLLGFTTLVVSTVAGSLIYGSLREESACLGEVSPLLDQAFDPDE